MEGSYCYQEAATPGGLGCLYVPWAPLDLTAEGVEYDDDGALLVKGAELLRVEERAARDGSRQYKLDRR
eukprot:4765995-Prymnesium_polylepis.1